MEVLAFSVFTYISIMGTQTSGSLKIERSASHYSKLDRKLSTICFSLASDASEIFPSALKEKAGQVKKKKKKIRKNPNDKEQNKKHCC